MHDRIDILNIFNKVPDRQICHLTDPTVDLLVGRFFAADIELRQLRIRFRSWFGRFAEECEHKHKYRLQTSADKVNLATAPPLNMPSGVYVLCVAVYR